MYFLVIFRKYFFTKQQLKVKICVYDFFFGVEGSKKLLTPQALDILVLLTVQEAAVIGFHLEGSGLVFARFVTKSCLVYASSEIVYTPLYIICHMVAMSHIWIFPREEFWSSHLPSKT